MTKLSTRQRVTLCGLLAVSALACMWLSTLEQVDLICWKYFPTRLACCSLFVNDTVPFWNDMAVLENAAAAGDMRALRTLLFVRMHTDGAISECFPDTHALVMRNGERGGMVIRRNKRLTMCYGHWLEDLSEGANRRMQR